MMMKDFLCLLISNVLGRGCGVGRGPTNDDEGFFISADFKSFRKEMWRGPTNDDEGFFVSADFKCFRKRLWDWEGAHYNDDEGFFVSDDFKSFRKEM